MESVSSTDSSRLIGRPMLEIPYSMAVSVSRDSEENCQIRLRSICNGTYPYGWSHSAINAVATPRTSYRSRHVQNRVQATRELPLAREGGRSVAALRAVPGFSVLKRSRRGICSFARLFPTPHPHKLGGSRRNTKTTKTVKMRPAVDPSLGPL